MKITGKKVVQSSKYLNFVATGFLNKNGEEDTWFSAERPNDGKTVLIAAIVDRKLLVTKEFRVPIGDFEWSLPAGLVDGAELIEEAATRELKEETNLDLIEIKRITPYLTNTAGMTNEVVSIVFCRAEGNINDSGTESSENIESFLMNKEQLIRLMEDSSKRISAKAYLIFDSFVNGNIW